MHHQRAPPARSYGTMSTPARQQGRLESPAATPTAALRCDVYAPDLRAPCVRRGWGWVRGCVGVRKSRAVRVRDGKGGGEGMSRRGKTGEDVRRESS